MAKLLVTFTYYLHCIVTQRVEDQEGCFQVLAERI